MAPPPARRPSVAWALLALDGRINREVFWLGNIFCAALAIAVARTELLIVVSPETGAVSTVNPLALGVFAVLVWTEVALVVKRLHDRGLTGWIALFLPIPVLSIIGFIVVGLMPGQRGGNPYAPGPNQRGR
ncbi:DUF805 domain-containing protein [Acuticoccus sp.]|uniref:DUF805 domain-containing protein n=1 Tax=Acuticoccus sp. TaxID=1904378 RepID=UPI003B52A9D8